MYKLITPPAVLALTLDEAKSYLRITGSANDTLITSIINGAILQAQEYAFCQFVNATWEKQFEYWPTDWELVLGKGKVSSVASVTYNDEDGVIQTWGAANYTLDDYSLPNALRIKADSYPVLNSRFPFIRVRYTVGFGAAATDVPADIKDALRLMVNQMFDVRSDERQPLPKASERILSQYRYKLINM